MEEKRVDAVHDATQELVTEVRLLQQRLSLVAPRVDRASLKFASQEVQQQSSGSGRAMRIYAGKTNGFTTLCKPFFDKLAAEKMKSSSSSNSSSGGGVDPVLTVVACGVNVRLSPPISKETIAVSVVLSVRPVQDPYTILPTLPTHSPAFLVEVFLVPFLV